MAEKEGREKATVEEAGSKGGKARAERLTAAQRREIAQKAAAARWQDKVPQATHVGVLKLVDVEIPCAVLPGGTRVLSETGMVKALGLYRSGAVHTREKDGAEPGAQLPLFVANKNIKPFVDEDLANVLQNPIWYAPPGGGTRHKGVKAEVIPRICDVWLRAKDAGKLRGSRQHIVAQKAYILTRALAQVAIVTLVDEATGYQYVRARDELQRLLVQYVSRELARWERTFEPDFYKHMYRLRGWPYDENNTKRSHYVARLTVDLTYDRIHPDLLKELKQTRDKGGKPNSKLHQWLTTGPTGGHPRLKQHLEGVTVLMKVAKSWEQFQYWVDMNYPKVNQTMLIPFPDPFEDCEDGMAAGQSEATASSSNEPEQPS